MQIMDAETGLWRRPWLAHFVLLKGSNLYVLKRVESKYPTKVLSLTKAQVRHILSTFDCLKQIYATDAVIPVAMERT